mmetsp:Transcript_25297/g.4187  ORF Transcript_25297/g.4187 Transcript_25297/m.4187 type:complete len:90 (-) Transcript_25297:628-897(-)
MPTIITIHQYSRPALTAPLPNRSPLPRVLPSVHIHNITSLIAQVRACSISIGQRQSSGIIKHDIAHPMPKIQIQQPRPHFKLRRSLKPP